MKVKFLSPGALFLSFCVVATACTNQDIYEAVKANRIQDCDKYTHEAAREECRENFQTSYKDYENARRADIEN